MSRWRKLLIGEISWKRLLRSAAVIYGSLLLIAVFFADRFIFIPPAPSYTEQHTQLQWIGSADQRIATFYYPASDAMPTLLWSHGNAEDLGYAAPVLEDLHALGFGILAYDYPGYGLSAGKPDEKSCYAAVLKSYQFLTEQHKVPADKIFIVGQSVGSGPATYLATQKPAAGLILITPFTSIYRVPFRYSIFPCDPFPNLNRIQGIALPLMVIHGDNDQIIPQNHGKTLVEAHRGVSVFHDLKGRGHNDISGSTQQQRVEYLQLFTDFAAARHF